MPTLDWMGKDKVVGHHRDVPYRLLERVPEKGILDEGGSDCGNMIIHGDNLEALKALLPEYEGRVDVIYIDPPYNTGNEGWVYNDNVNDPRIKKWLGQVVGKEGEDFSRHDKWLCMMYPRLALLRRLLGFDGVIFVSIDHNEEANLRLVMDEIFGAGCFVANVSWQRTLTKRNDSKGIPAETERVLIYSKNASWIPAKLPRTAEMDDGYSSPDGDPCPWTSVTCSAPGASTHQGMVYAIQHPITRELMYPPTNRCWSLGQEGMLACMGEWATYELRDIEDMETRKAICAGAEVSPHLPAIMLVDESDESVACSRERYELGARGKQPWPSFFFTRNGTGGIRRKKYLDPSSGRVATNFWPASEAGTTDGAYRALQAIFGGTSPFETPKPVELIELCLRVSGKKNALILDSFAGSGTTGDAVLRLNQEDGGNRRFILCEMMDYADTVTAERVRRVISGYGEGRRAVPSTGGGFSYYELGSQVFDGDGMLSPDVTRADLMVYVWYTETKAAFEDRTGEHPYLMGTLGDAAYYLAYEQGGETVLDYDLLGGLPVRGRPTVVYADRCALSRDTLERLDVRFKQIPRQIARM